MKTELQNWKGYQEFQLFALTVPIIEAFQGQNWKGTLLVSAVVYLLLKVTAWVGDVENGWLSLLRVIALAVVTADMLKRTSSSWPGKGTEWFVPLALLTLAMNTAGKGTAKAIASVNVLRYGTYAVLAVVCLSAGMNWKVRVLEQSLELPEISSLGVLLLPMVERETNTKKAPYIIIPILTAILTSGAAMGLYRYSMQLSIKGAAEHIESIVACAVTVGYYALLVYLLDCAQKEWETTAWKENPWFMPVYGAAVYAVMLLATEIKAEAQATMLLILWFAVPLALKTKDLKILKKVLDK